MKKNIFEKLEEADIIPKEKINKCAEKFDKDIEKSLLEFKKRQAQSLIDAQNKILD